MPVVLFLVYVIKHIYAIASLLKSFKHILLRTLENINSIDADEVGDYSSLTANSWWKM